MAKSKISHRAPLRPGLVVRTVLAVLITAIMVFPLFWMVSTALKTESEVMGSQLVFWPKVMQFENFRYVIDKVPSSATCSTPPWSR